jgi:hypothetical protein
VIIWFDLLARPQPGRAGTKKNSSLHRNSKWSKYGTGKRQEGPSKDTGLSKEEIEELI